MSKPIRAMMNAAFYTDSPERCRAWLDELLQGRAAPDEPARLVAALVPHAGWRFSGAAAAAAWAALRDRSEPRTIILFGAVHYPGVDAHTAYPGGAWETPLGPVEVDGKLAADLAKACEPQLRLGEEAHDQEHSLEVQLPFIKRLFPKARILPIAAPPGLEAASLGERIGHFTKDQPVIAVGSTDLTHYGERFLFAPRGSGPAAHAWMRENDQRLLTLVENLLERDIEIEVAAHHNACGPGAIAATLAFARAHGAERATVLTRTDSHEVDPDGEFHTAVGYAGVVV
jgi:hypothetical protein